MIRCGRVIVVLILLSCCFAAKAFADSDQYRYLDNRFNGKFVLGSGPKEVFCYILGIIDGAYKTDPFKMAKLYPDASKSGIIKRVEGYYRTHPKDLYTPVVDVVFSGCK